MKILVCTRKGFTKNNVKRVTTTTMRLFAKTQRMGSLEESLGLTKYREEVYIYCITEG